MNCPFCLNHQTHRHPEICRAHRAILNAQSQHFDQFPNFPIYIKIYAAALGNRPFAYAANLLRSAGLPYTANDGRVVTHA